MLKVPLTASPGEVMEAFEDAISDREYPEVDLVGAKQALLSPALRLQSEVSALLDTPYEDWKTIFISLRSSQSARQLIKAFETLAPVSKSNLLTHLACTRSADGHLLKSWVAAQSGVGASTVHKQISEIHKEAGIVRPELASIGPVVAHLKERQVKAVFEGFIAPPDCIPAFTECVNAILKDATPGRLDCLTTLGTEYARYLEQEMSIRQERVRSTLSALQGDPDGPGNLELFADALDFWNEASIPLQKLEAFKGRDDVAAKEMFNDIRSAALEFANEKSRPDMAMALSRQNHKVFSLLPRATKAVEEDIEALDGQLKSAKIKPLTDILAEIERSELDFVSELRRVDFFNSRAVLIERLRVTFKAVVEEVRDTELADVPWLLLRGLAIKLNNETKAEDAARLLARALITLADELNPSENVREKLEEDLATLERNAAEAELLKALNEKRFGAALEISEKLLARTPQGENRDTLIALRSKLQGQRNRRYFYWIAAAAVLGVVVVSNLNQRPGSNVTYPRPDHSPYASPNQTAPQYRPPPSQPPYREQAKEELPPIGTGFGLHPVSLTRT